MGSYAEYRTNVGITNNDMIRALRGQFKRYGKPTNAMVNNPENYGVCLCPEAERVLAATFGYASGLYITEVDFKSAVAPVKKSKRTKPNRLSVYLTDDMFHRIREVMEEEGYETVQEFLLNIIKQIIGG